MKRLFLFLCIIGICGFAYAGMQKDNVESKLVDIIKGVKRLAVQTAISLGNLNQDGKDIVQSWDSQIDTDDKTKLQGLNAKINDAKDTLDALNLYIETEWGSIE